MTSHSEPSIQANIGGGMAGFEFGRGERTLLFLHANGFNAGAYLPMLTPLADRARILAPDLRGHGATTLPADPKGRRNWSDMRDDVVRLIEDRGLQGVTLAGHSMGGTVSLLAPAQAPGRVRNLLLLDPVILSRPAAAMMRLPVVGLLARRHPWVAATLKRRRSFHSRAEAVRAYGGRGAFKDWPLEALQAYVRHGFRVAKDGRAELLTAPEWEASGYGAQANDTWGALRRAGRPMTILKAEHGSTCAVTRQDAARLSDLSVEILPGGTHFFPLVPPEATRAALLKALG